MTSWLSLVYLGSSLLLTARGCSVDGNKYRRFSYEELMFNFDLVVVGKDVRRVPSYSFEDGKDSEFTVSCVLKGDDKEIPVNITIVQVEPKVTCIGSEMTVGGEYIVGLRRYNATDYIWDLVNALQEVSFQNSSDNLNRAVRVCGLVSPRPPDGFLGTPYDFCRPKNLTSPCLSGSETHGLPLLVILVSVAFSCLFRHVD